MFHYSIRGRLLLWLAALLVAILTGLGVTAYQLYGINQFSQIDNELELRVAALQADWRSSRPPNGNGPPPPPPGAPGARPSSQGHDDEPAALPEGRLDPPLQSRPVFSTAEDPDRIPLAPRTKALFNEADVRGFYYAGWTSRGQLLTRSNNAPADLAHPPDAPAGRVYHRTRDTYQEVYYFTERGDCVLAGISLHRLTRASRQFAWTLVTASLAILVAGLAGAGMIVTYALRPVHVIGASAARIASGNLAERIDVPDKRSELGKLAGVLNSTFARLEAAFAEQKNFTADASHELRTPLAVLITEAQTSLARERNAADYRATVEVCLEAAQQMRRLAESLMQLARLDAGQEVMQRETIDLAEIVREAVHRLQPLAASRKIVTAQDLAPGILTGDPGRLGQVATNLLQNAIRYNHEGGKIHVTVRAEEDSVRLIVADTGQGISADDLPHIFARFFRADKARSRSDGSSGLGLSISKAIVEAHGGTIAATSALGYGTTFEVRFPK